MEFLMNELCASETLRKERDGQLTFFLLIVTGKGVFL